MSRTSDGFAIHGEDAGGGQTITTAVMGSMALVATMADGVIGAAGATAGNGRLDQMKRPPDGGGLFISHFVF